MSLDSIRGIAGKRAFDLVIRNVRIVNVFSESVMEGDIAVCGEEIAYVGRLDFDYQARETIEGYGRFAVPGFIDSHMHIESSMITPTQFARCVLPVGTTSVAADPHEIANVCGTEGVRVFTEAAKDLPLHVYMLAPSTVPSAPGYERSGAQVGPEEMEEMLSIPGICGMGELMDFNGVADGEERILSVIEAARKRGVLLDGHVPGLSGRRLQAFRASGVDCDHTYMDPVTTREKLELGFAVQIQRLFLTPELMAFLNEYPVQNRIMLVTDDVSFLPLVKEGHLNVVLREAIQLGLSPLKAIRYATINAADRLGLSDRGAIAPGRRADLLLLSELTELRPELVISDGEIVAENGRMRRELREAPFPETFQNSVQVPVLLAEDFAIRVPEKAEGEARVHLIVAAERGFRTKKRTAPLPVREGKLLCSGYLKMAVLFRHGEERKRQKELSLALIEGFPDFDGAVATSYAHDSHNLVIYGSSDAEMALAANRVRELGGGLCAVKGGQVLAEIPLPVAGILSEEAAERLVPVFERFFDALHKLGLTHSDPMGFLTLMALAVSPELKCTDLGLLDVVNKQFIPLLAEG